MSGIEFAAMASEKNPLQRLPRLEAASAVTRVIKILQEKRKNG